MTKDKFIINGLAGKKTLRGEVTINGAKNAVLKIMAASLLFKDDVSIKNVPNTEDVKRLTEILTLSGAEVIADTEKKELRVVTSKVSNYSIDPDIAKRMRASVVLTGPMLARYGKVTFPDPGGCVIGVRPVDLFIEGYRRMGAQIESKDGQYIITAPGGKLKGAEIVFNKQTVGGTETLMMAAVLASGTTVLKNCAMEPEIVHQAEYLNACGAQIKGAGTTTIEIIGGGLLESNGKPYVTMPDRIEAGSFLILGALCADNLIIKNCDPSHLEVVIAMLKDAGVPVETGKDVIKIVNNANIPNSSFVIKTGTIVTHEYPGISTDLQSPLVVFLTQTGGENIVFETIYEGRYKYTQDLIKMGAAITVMNTREILVKGGSEYTALEDEELQAYDIRAGFATVIAALLAKGNSTIKDVYYIDRGYENLEGRLQALGAKIERVRTEEKPV